MDTAHLATLSAFRASAYAAFGRRRDALFELCDTLLATGPISSLPLLSVQPVHQRRWGSLYDALAAGQVSSQSLEQLLINHPLASGEPIYAVDVSVWPRGDAETSAERALYYHASRHSAGQPIVAGWAYSWIAQVGFARESWTAPLRVRRRRPQENATAVAAEQIAAFLPHPQAADPLPWFLFDAGPATIQSSSPKRWGTRQLPFWCACARGAASTPTRRSSHGPVGPVVTATSSPAMRPRPGFRLKMT